VKLYVLEFLWLNFSATKSQRHKKPQNIKHLKSNVNLNFKQPFTDLILISENLSNLWLFIFNFALSIQTGVPGKIYDLGI